jgi:hypothetical protein
VIALLGRSVEAERVLESGAAAALDGNAKDRGLLGRLGCHQLLDLYGRRFGQRNKRARALDSLHKTQCSNVICRFKGASL